MKELDFSKRALEIDFLRGIAVLLVLFSHHWVFQPFNEMGWMGVDLFFVLSGFLVSGLLFHEYRKFGNIKPGLFLIRRGFKIYPLFYIAIGFTIVQMVFFPGLYLFPESQKLFLNSNGILVGAIIELFFLQSYFFGYWGHTWSLSVEELFYLTLSALIFLLIRKKMLSDSRRFTYLSLILLALILFFRVISVFINGITILNYTAFHLRLDSLLFGVLISYHYHFNKQKLADFFHKYKRVMQLIFFPLIIYVPFINVLDSKFILTIGFSFIYIAFGILLLHFLFVEGLMSKISKLISNQIVLLISKVGLYSYSIYLIHVFVVRYIVGEDYAHKQYLEGHYTYLQVLLSFVVYAFLSITLGIFISKLVEQPMLRIRDKYFPRRAD